MNLSRTSGQSLLGRLLRAPLRLIPQNAIFPILQGPLRGKKWIVGSSNHGCWLGSYEYEKQRVYKRSVKPGDVIYDIGANVGFYTLLSSVLTGNSGHVFAFEPLPGNLRYLRKHLELNYISNCSVIEAAVAGEEGEARFESRAERTEGRLSPIGTIVVRTVAIDSLLAQGGIRPPSLIKIDVEGAEIECLRGAARTIRTSHPIIFLATHGTEPHGACVSMLAEWGYRISPIDSRALKDSSEIIAEPSL